MVGWLVSLLVGCWLACHIGWLAVSRLVGCWLVGWLIGGLLPSWLLVGWLGGWFVVGWVAAGWLLVGGLLVCLPLVDWSVCWLVGCWLVAKSVAPMCATAGPTPCVVAPTPRPGGVICRGRNSPIVGAPPCCWLVGVVVG